MNPDEAVLLFVDEYSRMAEAYDANVVPRFVPFSERLIQRAGLRPHTTVLDVGTGTGLAALLAAKAVGGTGLVVGIDLADGALAVAQSKAARLGFRNVRFEMLDSRNIVYRGGTFDTALTSFALPTVGGEQVLREVHRVLKDGASFHVLNWAVRDPAGGWDAFDEVLLRHRTKATSKTLAQLREASDLVGEIREAGDFRDPNVLTAKMRDAGFASVRAERHAEPVPFASIDEVIAFQASFGSVDRELAEIDEASRLAFRDDLETRFQEYRRDGAIRLRWSVVFYEARK